MAFHIRGNRILTDKEVAEEAGYGALASLMMSVIPIIPLTILTWVGMHYAGKNGAIGCFIGGFIFSISIPSLRKPFLKSILVLLLLGGCSVGVMLVNK
jgi:hypothetical protein